MFSHTNTLLTRIFCLLHSSHPSTEEVSEHLLKETMPNVRLFHSMSRTLWPRLLPLLRPVHFDAEQVLCSQGEDVTEMFVIISGCFQGVTWFEGGGGGRKGGGAGEGEHKTRRILHSNCVNVLSALGVWHNAVETVTAETPGETYALTHIDFAGLFTSPGYVQQRKQR